MGERANKHILCFKGANGHMLASYSILSVIVPTLTAPKSCKNLPYFLRFQYFFAWCECGLFCV